jgi:ubiquinone/menaquinone biosynthesis C-methylase UbiE
MTSNTKQLELGYAGLALLRNRLVGSEQTADNIVEEISNLAQPGGEKTDVSKYKLQEGYKFWSETYDTIPNLLIEIEQPIVQDLFKNIKAGKALDAACGTGRHSNLLANAGFDITGVDSSSYMLKKARKKVPKAKFVQGDITNLPFDSESFDLVICALALSHFPSVYKVVKELTRVLKNGGTLILSDIHPFFVIIGGQAEFQDIKGKKGYIYNYIHMSSEYINSFKNCHLEVIDCIESIVESKYLTPSDLSLKISKQTFNTALANLPVALIWKLKK